MSHFLRGEAGVKGENEVLLTSGEKRSPRKTLQRGKDAADSLKLLYLNRLG